ncbi:hypothetical protein [Costertonia aggregata]|uniref:Lipocalin family protein n=1 Tax=Costertonia aggregata TaxID=343403 RepID=A0A7H9ARZ8_9FLAO|nr:hypothetical protein [Costertonia aggregata]QLG46220.1 hypothetical protein HYG79_12980 [Costertonia aggregata]
MKTYIEYYLILTLTLLCVSCSSDSEDDEPQNNTAQFVGTWNLVEYNISPPQDIDQNGIFFSNLLLELDCLNGTIVFNPDLTWTSTTTGINSSSITNGLFIINCTTNATVRNGNWTPTSATSINITGDITSTMSLSNGVLTLNNGEDLPSFQSIVYEKQ